MTPNATPPAPDNYHNRCQDLATVNHLGHVEFEPGAYLADGAEYLRHAACKLGSLEHISMTGLGQVECWHVSMLYPPSHKGHSVETTKIPIGGLVLQLCPSMSLGGAAVQSATSCGKVLLHAGIPASVYQTICRIVSNVSYPKLCSHDPWDLSMRPHDGHYWMSVQVDKMLQGAICADGERKQVTLAHMLTQSKGNLKCDAFVTLRVVTGLSISWHWRLDMTITDVLITDTTTAQSRSCRGREVVGRRAFSSSEVVAAAGGLQSSQAEGQPKKRRLSWGRRGGKAGGAGRCSAAQSHSLSSSTLLFCLTTPIHPITFTLPTHAAAEEGVTASTHQAASPSATSAHSLLTGHATTSGDSQFAADTLSHRTHRTQLSTTRASALMPS